MWRECFIWLQGIIYIWTYSCLWYIINREFLNQNYVFLEKMYSTCYQMNREKGLAKSILSQKVILFVLLVTSVLNLWFCLTIRSTHVIGSSPTARPSWDKALGSVIGNYPATSDKWYQIQKRIPDFNFWSGHGTPGLEHHSTSSFLLSSFWWITACDLWSLR